MCGTSELMCETSLVMCYASVLMFYAWVGMTLQDMDCHVWTLGDTLWIFTVVHLGHRAR